MIDTVKARAAAIAVVNAVLLVLALIGKIAESQIPELTASFGTAIDAVLGVTAALAVLLPSVFKKKEETK